MKRMIESITGGYTSSARVSGNALILTLPDATAPVVWRFDLSQVRSSALEVREQDDKFMLVIKTPRGDSHDVAAFTERGGAVRALMAASRALEGEPAFSGGDTGQTVSGDIPLTARRDEPRDDNGRYAARDHARRGGAGKWIFGILAIAIIAALFFAVRSQTPSAASFDGSLPGAAAADATPVPGASANASQSSGVPVSADQFLMQNGTKTGQ